MSAPTSRAERFGWVWLALICLYALFHSAAYALSNPVFESPDEPGHLQYVNHIAAGGRLPNQYLPDQFMAEGHQHPLYYLGAGLTLRALGGPIKVALPRNPRGGANPQFDHRYQAFAGGRDRVLFYALRLFGSAMVGAIALLTGLAARRLMPLGHVWMLAPFMVASLPELAYIGSSVSNDGLVALFGAAAVYAGVRCSLEPERRRRWISLGIWLGLAVLAKKSALALVPASLLLVAALAVGGTPKRKLALNAAQAALAALLLVSPVILRNLALYHEPLGNQMEIATLQDLVFPQDLHSRHFRVLFPDIVPRSFVAHFGWMIVAVNPVYVWPVVRGILGSAILSLGALLDSSRRAAALFCWAAFLSNLAGLVYYNLIFPQAQGRLLFASVAALALLCALGGHEVSRRVRLPYKGVLLVPVVIWLLWFDFLAFWTNSNFYTGPPW